MSISLKSFILPLTTNLIYSNPQGNMEMRFKHQSRQCHVLSKTPDCFQPYHTAIVFIFGPLLSYLFEAFPINSKGNINNLYWPWAIWRVIFLLFACLFFCFVAEIQIENCMCSTTDPVTRSPLFTTEASNFLREHKKENSQSHNVFPCAVMRHSVLRKLECRCY